MLGQENKIVEKDTVVKNYSLTLRPVDRNKFTPEEMDFLFYHTTPAYCFDAEFRKKAVQKLESTLK